MAIKKVWEIKLCHPDDGKTELHVAANDIDTAITAAVRIYNQRLKQTYGKDPPTASAKHVISAIAGAELDG